MSIAHRANGRESILLVEDDQSLSSHLADGLREEGFDVRIAASVREAEAAIDAGIPSLLLLDLGLPDGNGMNLLASLRRRLPDLPIIISTARGGVKDRVTGLETGSDDYLVKPYAFGELLARIRVQLRHAERAAGMFRFADVAVDLHNRTVTRAGCLVDLSPREFAFLSYLASLRGEIATREMLARQVWRIRSRMTSMDNVIDVHVWRLRQKLDEGREEPLIQTVRGVGFVLKGVS